jgi:hypothetical protein
MAGQRYGGDSSNYGAMKRPNGAAAKRPEVAPGPARSAFVGVRALGDAGVTRSLVASAPLTARHATCIGKPVDE